MSISIGSRACPSTRRSSSGALPPDLEQALVLLHSPRAAARFAVLAGNRRGAIRIAAISAETAAVAGAGWRSVDVAAAPRDQALLELAAKLCQTEARMNGDYDPVETYKPRRAWLRPLILPGIAFLLGLGAMGYLLGHWDAGARALGIAPPPPPRRSFRRRPLPRSRRRRKPPPPHRRPATSPSGS